MPAEATGALDGQICFSLYSTSMAVSRAYKPTLDRLGITYPQYLVLSALWENDGMTVGAIAERLALESSTVTPLVKRLETAGMLRRQRSLEDERLVQVYLDAKGIALQADTMCLGEMLLERSGMTLPQIDALNGQIQALRAELNRASEANAGLHSSQGD